MKIAIVTLQINANYGGILQAYALQTVLERMGHEVEHLQNPLYMVSYPIWKIPFVLCKRIYRKFFGGETFLPLWGHTYKIFCKNIDMFISSYIHIRYLGASDWNSSLAKEYDAIVFGSDQVWRPLYALPIERFFGDFLGASTIKKIAYAASFGIDENEYTNEQIVCCSSLLTTFQAVSVREQSAVSICRERFGVDSIHVLDPTLLLDVDDYINLFKKANIPLSKGTMAVYVLDENEQTNFIVDRLSHINGMVPFRIKSPIGDNKLPLDERMHLPVEQWLRAFYDAEFIVTDSFHGTVFSILFHKPFVCVSNMGRGMARFHSLLNMFGLEDRLVDISNLNELNLRGINWKAVDEILFKKRKEAVMFLEAALDVPLII